MIPKYITLFISICFVCLCGCDDYNKINTTSSTQNTNKDEVQTNCNELGFEIIKTVRDKKDPWNRVCLIKVKNHYYLNIVVSGDFSRDLTKVIIHDPDCPKCIEGNNKNVESTTNE